MERDHIGLIASDMDYTLLDENSQLPDGFAGLVRALEEEGIYFAAASGRPLYTLEAMFPTLRDHIALIGDNGGAIRWRGRDIYQSRMPGADYREMAAATREAGDVQDGQVVHIGDAGVKLGQHPGIALILALDVGAFHPAEDAEMLCTAKYGFLMANGSQDLRARVAFLAPPHWDQGVMQIMRQVLDQGGWVAPSDFTPAH